MDDAPYTDDLDLASVTTREELAALLRTVRLRADAPSLRVLEARTRHQVTPLVKTAGSEMLKGVRLPRKAVMRTFLQACGIPDDHLAPWIRAWERIAVGESELSPRLHGGTARAVAVQDDSQPSQPDAELREAGIPNPQAERLHEQISDLSAENDRLRLQLAAMDRQRAKKESRLADPANARATHSPIAARRELGVLLRALREEKGLGVEDVAEHLMCSVNKVKGMEASFRAGTPRDVRFLCDLYGLASEPERVRLMRLAEEGKQRGWWQAYGLAYDTHVGLEEEADKISAFQSSAIHGLLQTAEYARAGHDAAMPRLRPDQIELQIEAKLTRQRILTRGNLPRFAAVLDEATLHRMVGGPQVMVAQLGRIMEVAALPNVVIQVLPYAQGAHPAMESNFTILELPAPTPGIVYVEGLIGAVYLEQPQELRRYREVFGHLQSMALSPEGTADMIVAIGRSYEASSAARP